MPIPTTLRLLSTLTDALSSDVFLSALGGGAGGGVIGALVGGGITWWVTSRQTTKLFDHERTKTANEREITVLDELLPILHDVEHRIPRYRFSAFGKNEHAEFARDRLHYGQRAVVPRSTTQQVRERYDVLVCLLEEYETLEFSEVTDEYGDPVKRHRHHPGRVQDDIRGWIAYLRDTIEARMADRPLPDDVEHPPNLRLIDRETPWDWRGAPKHTPTKAIPIPWWKKDSGRG